MEYSKINALTKHGPDDYDLWTLTMPREKIFEIRQQSPVVEGDMRRVFEELPTADEGKINFVLPHSDGLRLYRVDMGEDFSYRNRHNGESVRGSREEIMADLREAVKAQGYSLRGNAAFQKVNILETLQTIMEHNTDFYQTDFQYDKEKLREAAEDRGGAREFFWMSRKSGTWCFWERDVYIRNINNHNTWEYYGGSRDERPKAFWVQILRMDDDKNIIGNVLEMDYQKHLDYLCTHSLEPTAIEVVFKNPNDVRTFSYQEYQQNWQAIGQRYGSVERSKFLVEDHHELARHVINARNLFWEATEPMTVQDYVKRLDHDLLHDYGYTADDLILTGPLDAEKAVRQGLNCYALHKDDTKELLADKDAFRDYHYSGCLFGMEKAEKQLLQYLNQTTMPLFTMQEVQTLCSLAAQAGMENDPAKNSVLDSVLHKLEHIPVRADEMTAVLPAHEQRENAEEEECQDF